jgi:hypothetical protein
VYCGGRPSNGLVWAGYRDDLGDARVVPATTTIVTEIA